jgi:hypothetical protein
MGETHEPILTPDCLSTQRARISQRNSNDLGLSPFPPDHHLLAVMGGFAVCHGADQ